MGVMKRLYTARILGTYSAPAAQRPDPRPLRPPRQARPPRPPGAPPAARPAVQGLLF